MTIEEEWKNLFSFHPYPMVKDLTEELRKEVLRKDLKGMVFGASGGIDSLVSAALCLRAREGNRGWRAVGLQMIDSRVKGESYNPEIFLEMGVELIVQDLTAEAVRMEKELGLPPRWLTSFLMKTVLMGLPASLLRRMILAIKKETAPRAILRHFQLLTLLHRLRIARLKEFATGHQLFPVICANRTEISLGYFVEGGIDDPRMGGYAPISGLYKSQVIALARYLGIPERAVAQKPSPGFGGIRDEDIIGPYELVDPVLVGIQGGCTDLEIEKALRSSAFLKDFGEVRRKWIRHLVPYLRFIRHLMEASARKREDDNTGQGRGKVEAITLNPDQEAYTC